MYLLIFRESKGYEGRERETETSMLEINVDSLPPMCTLMRDWTCSLSICLDWELNTQSFGIRGDTHSNQLSHLTRGPLFICWKRNQLKFAYELMNISTIWNRNFLNEDLWIFFTKYTFIIVIKFIIITYLKFIGIF